MNKKLRLMAIAIALCISSMMVFSGCGSKEDSEKDILDIEEIDIEDILSEESGEDESEIKVEKSNKDEYANMIQDFIDSTSFMADSDGNISKDSDYHLYKVHFTGDSYKDDFLNQGYTKEQWDSMTDYDKVVWGLMYGEAYKMFYSESKDLFIKDYDTYIYNLEELECFVNDKEGWEEINNAIKIIWDWHWETYQETGTIINPFDESFFDNSLISKDD